MLYLHFLPPTHFCCLGLAHLIGLNLHIVQLLSLGASLSLSEWLVSKPWGSVSVHLADVAVHHETAGRSPSPSCGCSCFHWIVLFLKMQRNKFHLAWRNACIPSEVSGEAQPALSFSRKLNLWCRPGDARGFRACMVPLEPAGALLLFFCLCTHFLKMHTCCDNTQPVTKQVRFVHMQKASLRYRFIMSPLFVLINCVA